MGLPLPHDALPAVLLDDLLDIDAIYREVGADAGAGSMDS